VVTVDGRYFDDGGEHGLSGCWGGGHTKTSLGSVGVMEGAGVVLAEPRVLESVGAVDLVCVGKEEPEVAEGFVRDEFKVREGVLVGDGAPKVSDERFAGSLGGEGGPHRGGRVVEAGWHC
jgi:hypothetical protein